MKLPTKRPSPIPLYPVPPIPPDSRPTRNSSELSDGFPPIKIGKEHRDFPVPSSSAAQHRSRYTKTGLGDKNILNSIDLKAPARSGFKVAVLI